MDTFSTYFILLTSVQYLIRFCSDKMLMSERPLSRDSVRWICQRMRSPYIAKKYGDYLSDEVKTRVGSFYIKKKFYNFQFATYLDDVRGFCTLILFLCHCLSSLRRKRYATIKNIEKERFSHIAEMRFNDGYIYNY